MKLQLLFSDGSIKRLRFVGSSVIYIVDFIYLKEILFLNWGQFWSINCLVSISCNFQSINHPTKYWLEEETRKLFLRKGQNYVVNRTFSSEEMNKLGTKILIIYLKLINGLKYLETAVVEETEVKQKMLRF